MWEKDNAMNFSKTFRKKKKRGLKFKLGKMFFFLFKENKNTMYKNFHLKSYV